MSEETLVRVREGVDATMVDGQMVLLEPTGGRYLSLDRVGSRIWEVIQEEQRVSAVVRRLSEEFDVDRDRLTADVHEFLERCEELHLVDTAPPQGS